MLAPEAEPKEKETMPLNVPPVSGETESLLAFLGQQRAAAAHAAYGLTEDQARSSSTGSTLSIGGLIKHLASAERGWIARLEGVDAGDPTDYTAYLAGFHLTDDETLAGALALYEEEAARSDKVIAGQADLGRIIALPKGVPWFPEAASVRWIVLHLIEETARHAGHADIIRESLDGASAGALMAAVEGWPETDWVTPWKPASS
jgi:uncharacterized damage-inducible protein DinB